MKTKSFLLTTTIKQEWARLMRQAIRTSEAYFNSDKWLLNITTDYMHQLHILTVQRGEKKKELNISETPTFDAWTYSNIK